MTMMMDWQPIETVPEDTKVLLYFPSTRRRCEVVVTGAHFSRDNSWECDLDYHGCPLLESPTYWHEMDYPEL